MPKTASPETLKIRRVMAGVPKDRLKDIRASDEKLLAKLQKLGIDVDAFHATIAVELSNRRKAEGLARPRRKGRRGPVIDIEGAIQELNDLGGLMEVKKAMETRDRLENKFLAKFGGVNAARQMLKYLQAAGGVKAIENMIGEVKKIDEQYVDKLGGPKLARIKIAHVHTVAQTIKR
jgi:hypothetical protein